MGRPRQHRAPTHAALWPLMQAYLDWTRMTGSAKDTHRRRESALRRFSAWCAERDLHRPAEITRPILERYQRQLRDARKPDGQPLTLGSQHVLLTPLQGFFKWLVRERRILYNPAAELILPKKPKQLPHTLLSVEDIEAVFAQPDLSTAEGLRDRAMLEVFYATGIRRLELANLDLSDVDARHVTLLIRAGKGQQDRFVPLGPRALAWIARYRQESRPCLQHDPHEPALFLTDQGHRFRRSALSARVKRLLEKAGIERPGSCHLFRHACATHMLKGGADIRVIQALLGHQSLETTQIYTHVALDHLAKIHAATHPLVTVESATLQAEPPEPSAGS
ncbi:MAG: site-specific tyrosine recombinase XerC [Candidatus Competibacter sp.]